MGSGGEDYVGYHTLLRTSFSVFFACLSRTGDTVGFPEFINRLASQIRKFFILLCSINHFISLQGKHFSCKVSTGQVGQCTVCHETRPGGGNEYSEIESL
jgi:hypothetical protein